MYQTKMAWLAWSINKATCWAIDMWTFCHFGYKVGGIFTQLYEYKQWWYAYSGFVLDEDSTQFSVVTTLVDQKVEKA